MIASVRRVLPLAASVAPQFTAAAVPVYTPAGGAFADQAPNASTGLAATRACGDDPGARKTTACRRCTHAH
jgi:hypothetical protein